ncbi:MAG: hypothetical protein ACKO96_14800 [Flammeovirgaceae bacterium]
MKTPEQLKQEFCSDALPEMSDFTFEYLDPANEESLYYPFSTIKGSTWETRPYLQFTLLNLAKTNHGYDYYTFNKAKMKFKVYTSGLFIEEETDTHLHMAFTLKLERIV